MNCPHCNSDQTNTDFLRHDWVSIECVNCDQEYQGPIIRTEPDISPELWHAGIIRREQAIRRNRRARA
jgi:hypothetical protein